jgi:uncharacterized protein
MSTFLSAEWRKLIFFNYTVSQEVLLPYLPVGTVLDTFQSQHYVSLVGFLFKDVRIKGVRIPFHHTFEEINLRFYVKRLLNDGSWRRGTVFIKEIVPKPAVTFIANTFYKEHYQTFPMRYNHHVDKVEYELFNKKWHKMKVQFNPEKRPINTNTEEEFITEHYYGYTRLSESRTSEYEVGHPSWTQYDVLKHQCAFDFEQLYGKNFADLSHQIPKSVILAEGSEIVVMGKQLLVESNNPYKNTGS